MIERRTVSQTIDTEKHKIYTETKNHLLCQGKHMGPYGQTVVALFDGGEIIVGYKRDCG